MPERWPRLSDTLTAGVGLDVCQSCGIYEGPMSCWQEHDDHDQREYRLVVLCRLCGDRLIEKHPRLYRRLDHFEPWPGAMELCRFCDHRAGNRCHNKTAKVNGGPGLEIRGPQPSAAIICKRGGTSRTAAVYPGPSVSCSGRSET